MVTGSVGADLGRERGQIHAPSGTSCESPQLDGLGQHLGGVRQPGRVERGAQRRLRGEVGRGEHQRHQVALLEPDAVLAAQHPAGGDRHAHDLLAGGVHPLDHAGFALVEHQQRVQVAVAGVEHVHHEDPVAVGDLVHLSQHVGQRSTRHDRVVQVVVRLDPGDRTERGLAALPDQRPLGFVLGDAHRAAPVLAGDRDDALDLVGPSPCTGPATSTSSSAAASVGSPAWMYASTACTHS